MGQNCSASFSDSGKFSATICRFLLRKSWRMSSMSSSDTLCSTITRDCEEDSWASAFSYGLTASTNKPPSNIPGNTPTHKFAFMVILLEPAQTPAKLKVQFVRLERLAWLLLAVGKTRVRYDLFHRYRSSGTVISASRTAVWSSFMCARCLINGVTRTNRYVEEQVRYADLSE